MKISGFINQTVRSTAVFSLLLLLSACAETMARQRYQESLNYDVTGALLVQERTLVRLEQEARTGESVDPEYLAKAALQLNEVNQLATERIASERANDQGRNDLAEREAFLAYTESSIRLAVLANSLDGAWLTKLKQSKDRSSPGFFDESRGMIPYFSKYFPGVTGAGPSTREVLDEEPEAARFRSESERNLKRLEAVYPKLAAGRIKSQESSDAVKRTEYRQAQEAALVTHAAYEQQIHEAGLEARVNECRYGPLFSEMRAAIAITPFIDRLKNDEAPISEADRRRSESFLEELSKVSCECLVAKIDSQNSELQRRFYSMIKGKRQWDLYGSPMADDVGVQFLALYLPCSEFASLIVK